MYETGNAVTKLCTDKKKQKQNIRKKPCWKENHTERNFITEKSAVNSYWN